jgi:glycosyltransferase involved in cell wall biosynthesis
MRDQGIDLVHVNGPFGLLYAGLAARSLGLPVVFTSHLAEDTRNAFKRLLVRAIPSQVIAVSRSIAVATQAAGARPERVRHIPLGIDPKAYELDSKARERWRSRLGWSDEQLVVCGILARVQPVKGQLRFLEAVSQASRRDPRLRGLLIGSPWPGDTTAREYDRQIDDFIHRAALEGSVTRLPFTNDARGALSALDVVVIASDTESFGRVALEALACGRPVVSTPCGGPQEILDNSGAGIVTRDLSAEALAEALAQMTNDAERRRSLGDAGRRLVAERFSLDLMARRTLEIYETAITRSAGRPSKRGQAPA